MKTAWQWILFLWALTPALANVSATAGETIRYVHTDHLGTPIAWTDENGNVVKTSEYEPYGLVLNRAPDDSPGYTGHVEDAATGLTYMQQRYYDSGIGRFMSVDPVIFESGGVDHFNRYWYANGNPLLYLDPNGEDTLTVYGSLSLQAFGFGGEISVEIGVSFGDDPFDIGVAGTFSTPQEIEGIPDQVGVDTGANIGGAHYDASLEELDSISTESIEIDVANVSVEAVSNSETGERYGHVSV